MPTNSSSQNEADRVIPMEHFLVISKSVVGLIGAEAIYHSQARTSHKANLPLAVTPSWRAENAPL